MAENSSANLSTSGYEQTDSFFKEEFQVVSTMPPLPPTEKSYKLDSTLDEDSNRLLQFAEKFGFMSIEPNQTEIEKDVDLDLQFPPINEDNIHPSFKEFTKMNEIGIVEIDLKKLEKMVCSLGLDETIEDDPSQKEIDVQFLKEKVLKYDEILNKDDEHSAKLTETEKDHSTEDQRTDKFTAFKYERKDTLWDRKPHLRQMSREILLHKFHNVNFTNENLETFSKSLINNIELDLNRALNILRRIAYPKLCEKHFSSEFPFGAFAKEDEPAENISISVDHFEFLHEEFPKELPENFLEFFEKEGIDLEKDPEINNIVPSFIKFLESGKGFQFPKNCFTLILAVLRNPYRKIEVFYDYELPVVKEQMVIAKFLMTCLQIPEILDDEDAYEKLAEAIIRFANVHPSFLAYILARFNALLSNQIDGKLAYQIYCKVLNLMTCIGSTIIDLCLPQHFENMAYLAAKDRNCDLYFHLLRACEMSIANAIEHESWVKAESSDDEAVVLFYNACYKYFRHDLISRLMPVLKKYEKSKDREEQYLSKKHAIFPTKNGYMNAEMQFLINKNKNSADCKSSSFPSIKKCTFNYAGKVLFGSSYAQLGYIIQKDMQELSYVDVADDVEYWNTNNEFPLSWKL